jgi:hypothetical protein
MMKLGGFFKSSRGVHQGDPLSSLLFIVAQELLGRGLNSLLSSSTFIPYSVPQRCLLISHLSFANDTIIFAIASSKTLSVLTKLLDDFQNASRQHTNHDKSSFTLSSKVSKNRRFWFIKF